MIHKKNFWNSLPILLSATVFVAVFLTMLSMGSVILLLLKIGLIRQIAPPDFGMTIIITGIISTIVGTTIAYLISKVPLRPLNTIISAMSQVASGNFKLRLQPRGSAGDLYDLYSSFNSMVEELDGVEILREDFINNFSHEFKTPIVSIRGFAKMLKNAELTTEEREEYLDIIIDESDRLATLSTSILMLSHLEHQTILSNTALFPLGEQIRRCILILQSRWEAKNLEIDAHIPDLDFHGSETLLGQVWMNLLDNAIKFTPEGGTISIQLLAAEDCLICRFQNSGPPISQEGLTRIFEKFYQDDHSRSTIGNGLGLSVVSKIAALHGGHAEVRNLPDSGVEFSVTLPLQ